MTTMYSAFFSSGLLAPPHTPHSSYNARYDPFDDHSAPDSDIDIDDDREITPTPQNHSLTTTSTAGTNQQRPRLRKRRSSLTVACSPMNAIRSPIRSAGAALQLQMHLPNPSRSRSGSLNQGVPADGYASNISLTAAGLGLGFRTSAGGNDSNSCAMETVSIIGRIRSSSVSGVLR